MAVALRCALRSAERSCAAAPIVLQEIADAVQSITQGAALDIQTFSGLVVLTDVREVGGEGFGEFHRSVLVVIQQCR
jgi:hypothetical protein